MEVPVVLMLFCVVVGGVTAATEPFRIGAFNIQVFGRSKMDKPEVVKILVKTLQRYDIVLIQEIRDSSGEAIKQLLEDVNQGPHPYKMEISARLGRTSSKEQYAYMYRDDVGLTVKDTYQYPDDQDIFQREPYAVVFDSKYTAISQFILAGIHTDPDEAPAEIDGLVKVHDALENKYKTDNILLMGDFNADCNYVSQKKLNALLMRQDKKYHWFVPDDWDTTVAGTTCAYDRFVMTGSTFINAVEPDSTSIYRFDLENGLTQDQAELVSDHYPIELTLKQYATPLTSSANRMGSAAESACQSLQGQITELIELLKIYNRGDNTLDSEEGKEGCMVDNG